MYYCNVDYLKLCCVPLIECCKISLSLAMYLSNLRYQCILVLFTKESIKKNICSAETARLNTLYGHSGEDPACPKNSLAIT